MKNLENKILGIYIFIIIILPLFLGVGSIAIIYPLGALILLFYSLVRAK
jgi:hypothetical protein